MTTEVSPLESGGESPALAPNLRTLQERQMWGVLIVSVQSDSAEILLVFFFFSQSIDCEDEVQMQEVNLVIDNCKQHRGWVGRSYWLLECLLSMPKAMGLNPEHPTHWARPHICHLAT